MLSSVANIGLNLSRISAGILSRLLTSLSGNSLKSFVEASSDPTERDRDGTLVLCRAEKILYLYAVGRYNLILFSLSYFENEICLVSRKFFFMNFGFKNECRNEFKDNNEKLCS